MKLFLSLPMSSQTDEQVVEHIKTMQCAWYNFVESQISSESEEDNDHDFFKETTFVDSFTNNLNCDYYKNRDHYSIACLGTALIKLAECDAIFIGSGWKNSRGCKLEYEVAKAYHLDIYFENADDVPDEETEDEDQELKEYKESLASTLATFQNDVDAYMAKKKEENRLWFENKEAIFKQVMEESTPEAVLPVVEEVIPEVKIRYFHDKYGDYPEIEAYNGNFMDIALPEDTVIPTKGYALVNLGFATELPEGYWAQLVPRSSTFKKYGLILTNSFGVIDTSYKGDGDEWMACLYNMYGKDAVLPKGTRIMQFRVVKDHPVNFNKVEHLGNPDRGGFGSTGN